MATSVDPNTLVKAVQERVWELDDDIVLAEAQTMEAVLSDSLSDPRSVAAIIVLFASAAVALAALGLYGVLSFFVNQRRQEIGIRLALGASGSNVLQLVALRGMVLVAAGCVVGIVGSVGVGRLVEGMLFRAAHHRPQRFQVMVRAPRRPIMCGRVGVGFHVRGNLEEAATVVMNTPRGHMRVASPETTALELVGYQRYVGGLDNAATVLTELAEVVSVSGLADQARTVPVAWVQRLGFLLELVGQGEVAAPLRGFVEDQARRVVPLDPALPRTGAPRSGRWRIAVNAEVEPDL